MPPKSPPRTRAKTALKVYQDYPASPSDSTHPDAPPVSNPDAATEPGPSARTELEPSESEARTATAATTTKHAANVTTCDYAERGMAERSTTEPLRQQPSRALSVRSQRSNASVTLRIRQAELEAEERLAEIRRKELRIQETLIKKRLAAEVAEIREDNDAASVNREGDGTAERHVNEWLQQHRLRGEQREYNEPIETNTGTRIRSTPEERIAPPRPTANQTVSKPRRQGSPLPEQHRDENAFDRLTIALEKMASHRPPTRQMQELPIFSGGAKEWLPFRAAMRDSTKLFKLSPAENLARLRACLRGEARTAVSALLFTATDPSVIMNTLEQFYGRPEMIIDEAIEDIRRMPRLGTTVTELNGFAIKLQNIVTVIASLDERGYLQNPMLARQVTEKLTPYMKTRWCDYAEEYGDLREAEIITLSKFLMREADRAVRHAYSAAAARGQGSRPNEGNAKRTEERSRANERNRGTVLATTEEKDSAKAKKDECLCCGGEHRTPLCRKLEALTVNERWLWAKEARVCFRCLDSKHRRFRCKGKKCGINECTQAHHALLHSSERQKEAPEDQKEDSAITASARVPEETLQILLKVCPITIRGRNGKELSTHALLDEGSTITLVDEEIASLIGTRGPVRALNIVGATSNQREPESQIVNIGVRGQSQNSFQQIKARTVKNLTLGNHSVRTELLRLPHLRELKPEAVCYSNARPRVLIGADNWHLIVTRKLLTGKRNQPAASLTELGWIIHGNAPLRTIERDTEIICHVRTLQGNQDRDDELNELVKTHFDIDALGVSSKRKPDPKEERAKEIFERTVKRKKDCFEVGLPWATDEPTMPPSYDMAMRRLRGIERKMDKSPEFKNAYTGQVLKLFEKGYAAKSDEDHPRKERLWYLPHFAVTNPNKPGKIRMVFDAAARANGTCLNDALLDGPDLLQSLHSILFRFRMKPVAITADIREMFLRIKIRTEDQVAQHFLWRGDDRSTPPQKYVMTSMIFGARSSPFLAHSVRDRNAADFKESHPLAYYAITGSHYMDDWVQSFDDEDIAARTMSEVQEVHSKAGFELAGWNSNKEHLLREIPDENRARAPKELAANTHLYEKALGILWIPTSDELGFNTAMNRVPVQVKDAQRPPTKREALGAVMSLFDPLGLLSPYTITAKIMLQELWKKKVGWDDPLPPEEALTFDEWQSDLRHIAELRLPRCYDQRSDVTQRQLHVFCDASEQAYAAVAYWRLSSHEGVHVSIVAGKAKVAPLRPQSIPRMELQAGLIGARLAANIVSCHQWDTEVIFWSDSKTVLHWIRNDATRYTPFVAHRLGEIAELTKPDQWRWIPTTLNVADDATRAGNTELKRDSRWFTGPQFLHESEDCWPIPIAPETTEEEVVVTHTKEKSTLVEVCRFSSYERLVRTVAYVLAFIDKCRKSARRLGLKHIRRAECLLIQQSQSESFSEEISRLSKGQNVDRTSRLYKLDPVYNEDKIIRLNGRINAATVPDEMKQPPILDGNHQITRLIIRQEHLANGHVGREQIVNNLRQRYWILRLRPNVRATLHQCIRCKIKRSNPEKPVKGDLPQIRLNTHTRSFSRCGIDCFGPMWVTIGRRREKRWGMLFTCLATRAIHVELIASLDVDSAIMAIRRMAARRGMPCLIASDNGTNFHGADIELNRAFTEWLPALKDYALTKRIEWRYIDPGAPNQGGAWERMIKSVKRALAVTLTERAPKEEVLATLMTEIEHTVNSRPLTHVPIEAEDQEALTPNHFLLGTSVGLPYVGECEKADRRTWRAAQALANMFWARWIKEYLPTLAPRGDVRRKPNNVKPGDIVIIADGTLPRNTWPRGQVERVYRGPDGVVRSVEVRTKGGIFRRPVRRLIVLPIEKGCEGLRQGETVTDGAGST